MLYLSIEDTVCEGRGGSALCCLPGVLRKFTFWEEVPLHVVLRGKESLRGGVDLTQKLHLFLIF